MPASSIMTIRILASIVPLLLYVGIILVMGRVKLDEKVKGFSHEQYAEAQITEA